MLLRVIFAILLCLIAVGLLSVAASSATHNSDRGAFADRNDLLQLEAAIERYRAFNGGPPADMHSPKFNSFIERVYGKELASDPKIEQLDRAEILTFLLCPPTWPMKAENEDVFFEFDDSRLTDKDNDGWLEYRFKDGRLFLIRNGEVSLWNEETNQYQFAD